MLNRNNLDLSWVSLATYEEVEDFANQREVEREKINPIAKTMRLLWIGSISLALS